MAAVVTLTNNEPPLVAPPDFMLTEFVHDKFYRVGELLKNNAHLIVRDLIKDCDLTQGYSDDTQNAANATPKLSGRGHDIFKQFNTSAFCKNHIYTDSILFRKMFGMDYPSIRDKIKNVRVASTRGGKGVVEVQVIDSNAPPPTPHPVPGEPSANTGRTITKKSVSLYSYIDINIIDLPEIRL